MQCMPYSTAVLLQACACLHRSAVCVWRAERPQRKVETMKSLHAHHSSHSGNAATLQPGQPVHTLVVARGHSVQLKTAAGCLWLTCDGALEDWFLPTGRQITVQGPACLRLGSAHLHRAAEVQWQTSPLQRDHRCSLQEPQQLLYAGSRFSRISAAWAWACKPSP